MPPVAVLGLSMQAEVTYAMPRTIAPQPAPEPTDKPSEESPQDEGEVWFDVDLDEVETTIRISLDESKRLVEAAFAKPE